MKEVIDIQRGGTKRICKMGIKGFSKLERMRKQLEEKGAFEDYLNKIELKEKVEEEMPPELTVVELKGIDEFSPTIYGYQAWLEKHDGSLIQYMDAIADNDGIKNDIRRLMKKMDRLQLLKTLEFVYALIYPKNEKEEKEERDF